MTRISSIPLTLALLLSLLSDARAAPRPSTPPLSLSLLRRTKSTLSHDEWIAWANNQKEHLKVKYGASNSAHTRKRQSSGTNLLINQGVDSSYIGSLAVGTPPVAFDVILDTGSSDFWLAAPGCTTCGNTPTFNTAESSSFQNLNNDFSVDYGSGSASGLLAQEVVQMAGFSIPNQIMGVCSNISQDFLSNPVSGLMGLGFQSIASSGATPFWQTLASSNVWSEPVMAFQITRFINQTDARNLEPGGSFTMGATNPSLFTGEIEYTDIPAGQEGFWVLPMSSISAQGSVLPVPSSESSAAIDTGTTLIAGPQDVVEEVYAQIPGSQPVANAEGYFSYPCDTEVEVSLSFGGQSWSISPNDFLVHRIGQEDSAQCVGALFSVQLGGAGSPTWIVGDTFLKNVYSVFRFSPPSVGFAALSETADLVSNVHGSVPAATIGSIAAVVSATAAATNNLGGPLTSNSVGAPQTLNVVLVLSGLLSAVWMLL